MTILPTGLFWLQVAQTQLKLAWIKKKKGNFWVHITEKFRGYSDFQLPKEFIRNQSFLPSFYLTLWAQRAPISIRLLAHIVTPK